MSRSKIALLPVARRDAAQRALTAAFGRASFDDIRKLTTGASGSLIYRIEVAGKPYLLRLEALDGDENRDPQRSFLCMTRAAQAAIAPPLHYVDASSGVAIMDFLPERELDDYPGGRAALARALGQMVARLQATAPFPRSRSYIDVLARLVERLRYSGRFAPGLLDRHYEGFERIREVYPWDDATLVSSHNDLHPGNILFDGNRLWLIDWDAAYCNDALLDVAVLSNFFATTPALQASLLQGWLGRPADRVTLARLVLMRQLGRLFYACTSALFVAERQARPTPPETDLAALSPAQFHAGVVRGSIVLGTVQAMRIGSKVSLATFMAGLLDPKFNQAIDTLRRG